MARVFVAVRIKPTRGIMALLAQLRRLGRPVKTVADENLHVTLRFLGQTDEALFRPIVNAIHTAVDNAKAFDLNLVGLGAYPYIHRPKSVWAGVDNADTLSKIAHGLATPLEDLGFAPEERPWVPHVTLCRIKARPPKELVDLLNADHSVSLGTVRIRSVDLLSSQLLPSGPLYTTVDRVLLE